MKKSDKKTFIIISVVIVTLALVFLPATIYSNYKYSINNSDSVSEEKKDEENDKSDSEFDDMVLPTVVAHAAVLDWSAFGTPSFEEDE